MKRYVRVTIIILAIILVAVYFTISFAIKHVLPYSPIRPYRYSQTEISRQLGNSYDPSSIGLRWKDFNITVEDSIGLKGWFVYSSVHPSKGTIVLLHGIASCRQFMLPLAYELSKNGFNCLLYDSRANGESGGLNCTFGYYEQHDVSAYLDSTQLIFPNSGPYAVFGNSLGAAVAIQSMAQDKRLTCGVIESPFANLREIIHDYFRRTFFLPIYSIADKALENSESIAKFQVDSVCPEISAKHITQPVMIIHGLEDRHVLPNYGERVYENLASKEKVWYPVINGTHYNLARVGGAEYKKRIIEFFNKYMSGNN